MVAVDVTTGAETALGTVGDLRSWSGQSVVNPTNDTMLFWGSNGIDNKVYEMDLSTGMALSSWTVTSPIEDPRIVF